MSSKISKKNIKKDELKEKKDEKPNENSFENEKEKKYKEKEEKNNLIEKSLEKEKEKEYSEWNINYNKYYNVSKMELKTKIFMNENKCSYEFNIFPNGNILLIENNNIIIYDSKTFKPIFHFPFNDICDIIILSNNSLLIQSYKSDTNEIQILNFSKDKNEIIKVVDIEIHSSYIDLDNITNRVMNKLNNNVILFCYNENEDQDNYDLMNFHNNNNGITESTHHFMFYKYINNNLILEYKESLIIKNFYKIFLPYEDSFFLYGNFTNSLQIDSYFLYYYKNKKMNILKDDIEDDVIYNCIIFNKKYLIVQYKTKIEKYFIIDEGIIFVSEYKVENVMYLMRNKFNLIIVSSKYLDINEEYLYFSEVDENYKTIKEEIFSVGNFIKILFYKKRLYVFSNELSVYS